MYTLYRLEASELDAKFLDALKLLFKDQSIEISIQNIEPRILKRNLGDVIDDFRRQVSSLEISPDEDLFTGIRDRHPGREVTF